MSENCEWKPEITVGSGEFCDGESIIEKVKEKGQKREQLGILRWPLIR